MEKATVQPSSGGKRSGSTTRSLSEHMSSPWAPDITFCISAASPTLRAIGP